MTEYQPKHMKKPEKPEKMVCRFYPDRPCPLHNLQCSAPTCQIPESEYLRSLEDLPQPGKPTMNLLHAEVDSVRGAFQRKERLCSCGDIAYHPAGCAPSGCMNRPA